MSLTRKALLGVNSDNRMELFPQPYFAAEHRLIADRPFSLQRFMERQRALVPRRFQKPYEEPIWAIKDGELGTPEPHLVVATNHEANMVWQHQHERLLPVSVVGLTRTSDGYLLLGLRRMYPGKGKLCPIPTGSASSIHGHPIVAAFHSEAYEETGTRPEQFGPLYLLGAQEVGNGFGKTLYYTLFSDTTRSSEEILIGHNLAHLIGRSQEDWNIWRMRERVAPITSLGKDFWENDCLVLLPDSSYSVRRAIDHGDVAGLPLLELTVSSLLMRDWSGIPYARENGSLPSVGTCDEYLKQGSMPRRLLHISH